MASPAALSDPSILAWQGSTTRPSGLCKDMHVIRPANLTNDMHDKVDLAPGSSGFWSIRGGQQLLTGRSVQTKELQEEYIVNTL